MARASQSIRRDLNEVIGNAKGTQGGVKVCRPAAVDVVEVRGRFGFTQAQFAPRFGVSVAALRHWERGHRNPQDPALVRLNLIGRDPKGVLRALSRRRRARTTSASPRCARQIATNKRLATQT